MYMYIFGPPVLRWIQVLFITWYTEPLFRVRVLLYLSHKFLSFPRLVYVLRLEQTTPARWPFYGRCRSSTSVTATVSSTGSSDAVVFLRSSHHLLRVVRHHHVLAVIASSALRGLHRAPPSSVWIDSLPLGVWIESPLPSRFWIGSLWPSQFWIAAAFTIRGSPPLLRFGIGIDSPSSSSGSIYNWVGLLGCIDSIVCLGSIIARSALLVSASLAVGQFSDHLFWFVAKKRKKVKKRGLPVSVGLSFATLLVASCHEQIVGY
jgi:hypothetical protein